MGKCFYLRKGDVHTAPSNLPPIGTALNDMTWEEVRAISDAGLAADYFAVGDTKAVPIKGTIGSLAVDATYYVFVLGIDHNESVEGKGVHFGCFRKTQSEEYDMSLFESGYWSIASENHFVMNATSTNVGGWKESHMRNTIIPSFLSALPAELQAVIRSITKYTDNTGNGSNTASYVTTTEDRVFLLSEYEVQGARTYANSAEQNYQKQYDYYKAGNSSIRRSQEDGNAENIYTWLRSVTGENPGNFCLFGKTHGTSARTNAYYSCGFAPAFAV